MTSTAAPRSVQAAPVAVLTVAACAWVALAALAESPWASTVSASTFDRIQTQPSTIGAFAGGWLLMVLAMMLPTTLVLVSTFDRLVARREEARDLRLLLLGGYVCVWVVAGLALETIALSIRLVAGGAPILIGVLFLAGVYQYASGKSRYLRRSRASTALIGRYWTEASPRGSAARVGIAHGLACVGCCWALMLVMVSRGGCPLLWMEALTGIMVAEKATPLGHRARKATGGILLTGALLVALTT